MGTSDLLKIYARARGPERALVLMHIFQANHLCPYYNYNIKVTHLHVWETAGMHCEKEEYKMVYLMA